MLRFIRELASAFAQNRGDGRRASGTSQTTRSVHAIAAVHARGCRVLCVAAIGAALPSCASIGPATVPQDRVDYANALSDSWKDQMLLNIVRLRYGDTPTFMDVSSVISAYTLQGAIQAGGTVNVGVPGSSTTLPGGTGTVSAVGGYNDRPTISYTPLSGQKFARSLLHPIPPEAVFSLISAGYPADVVIPVTVRALNGIYNRTSQGGFRRPSEPEFDLLVDALRRIQLSRAFSMRFEKRGDDQIGIAVFASERSPELQRDIDFVKKTLNLRAENREISLTFGALQRTPTELAVLTRSMVEVMAELAADIEVPAEHVAEGRTFPTPELPATASPYDRPQVRIQSGPAPSADAFAAARYRNSWYWVSDRDLSSKRSLTFLLLFFSLAETGVVPEAPVLTLPVQ